jgi:hypothetical protein
MCFGIGISIIWQFVCGCTWWPLAVGSRHSTISISSISISVKKRRASITFSGVLKEIELTCLEYVAMDEAYLLDGVIDLHLTIAGLK